LQYSVYLSKFCLFLNIIRRRLKGKIKNIQMAETEAEKTKGSSRQKPKSDAREKKKLA